MEKGHDATLEDFEQIDTNSQRELSMHLTLLVDHIYNILDFVGKEPTDV